MHVRAKAIYGNRRLPLVILSKKKKKNQQRTTEASSRGKNNGKNTTGVRHLDNEERSQRERVPRSILDQWLSIAGLFAAFSMAAAHLCSLVICVRDFQRNSAELRWRRLLLNTRPKRNNRIIPTCNVPPLLFTRRRRIYFSCGNGCWRD